MKRLNLFYGAAALAAVLMAASTSAYAQDNGNRDEYGNEIAVPFEIVDISPVGVDISRPIAPSIKLTNQGMMVSKDNKYFRVGFQEVYVGEGGGIPIQSWISTLESNAWPTVKNASSGGVYVDWQTDPDTYETTVGILKVKP